MARSCGDALCEGQRDGAWVHVDTMLGGRAACAMQGWSPRGRPGRGRRGLSTYCAACRPRNGLWGAAPYLTMYASLCPACTAMSYVM